MDQNITPETDFEYEEVTIVDVRKEEDGWSIKRDDGGWFWVRNEHGIEPKVGDVARFYGRGVGSIVRGLTLNGRVVFYRTPAEQEEANRKRREEWEVEKRREYDERKAECDAQFAALPEPFQQRIARFRAFNPDWSWQYELYEIFTCAEAIKIAERFKDDVEGIRAFQSVEWEEQKRLVPDLDDGHSGNTFGTACRLAYLYLTQPDLVPKDHGALCPLVGCREYGCWSVEAGS